MNTGLYRLWVLEQQSAFMCAHVHTQTRAGVSRYTEQSKNALSSKHVRLLGHKCPTKPSLCCNAHTAFRFYLPNRLSTTHIQSNQITHVHKLTHFETPNQCRKYHYRINAALNQLRVRECVCVCVLDYKTVIGKMLITP